MCAWTCAAASDMQHLGLVRILLTVQAGSPGGLPAAVVLGWQRHDGDQKTSLTLHPGDMDPSGWMKIVLIGVVTHVRLAQ